MTKINVDASGARFLPWAKDRLTRLTELRHELDLPKMTKLYVPEPGALVHIVSSEFGDSIRIQAGTSLGTATYDDGASLSAEAVVSASGKVIGPARTRIAFLDIPVLGAGFTAAFRDSGVVNSDRALTSGFPSAEGAETFTSVLGGFVPITPILLETYSPDASRFTAVLTTLDAFTDLGDLHIHALTYDKTAPADARWTDTTDELLPAAATGSATGLSTLDMTTFDFVQSVELQYQLPTPLSVGGNTLIKTFAFYREGIRATTLGHDVSAPHTGFVVKSYVTSATPGTEFTDHVAGVPVARAAWVDLAGKDDIWLFTRDPVTLATTVQLAYTLNWTAAFVIANKGGANFVAGTPGSGTRIKDLPASATAHMGGDSLTAIPGNMFSFLFRALDCGHDGTTHFVARGKVSAGAITIAGTGPSFLDAAGAPGNMDSRTAANGTPTVELLVGGVSAGTSTGTSGVKGAVTIDTPNERLPLPYTARQGRFGYRFTFGGTSFKGVFWDGAAALEQTRTGLSANLYAWGVHPTADLYATGWHNESLSVVLEGAPTTVPLTATEDFLALDEVKADRLYTIRDLLTLGAARTVQQTFTPEASEKLLKSAETWVREGVTLTEQSEDLVIPHAARPASDRRVLVENP